MRISVAKREALRERVEKLIPHMKKSDIVKHLAIEGIARRTIYDTIDRMQTTSNISDNKKLDVVMSCNFKQIKRLILTSIKIN